MYSFYCGLLLLWLLLLIPIVRSKGWARICLMVVVTLAVLAGLHEIRMYLGSPAAIRIDIILISMALAVLYVASSVLLFLKGWTKTAITFVAFLTAIGVGMGYEWSKVRNESARVNAAFEETNRLLFKAKFRDQNTYLKYFKTISNEDNRFPAGHWQAEQEGQFTRVIINSSGHVWLFYQCQDDAECHYGPQGSGLQESDTKLQWTASIRHRVGTPFDINIKQLPGEILELKRGDYKQQFIKRPPPIEQNSGQNALQFAGAFSNVKCEGAHSRVHQVWLWNGETRSYAVGVFSTLVAGRINRFISPVIMGKGELVNDVSNFTWTNNETSGKSVIEVTPSGAIMSLDQDLNENGRTLEDVDKLLLKKSAIIKDERIELAPLTSEKDWQHWFDNVMVGYFVVGEIPEC